MENKEKEIKEESSIEQEKGLYKTKEKIEENKYIEIFYQDNDGTYYINQKNFIDTIILVVFILFFVFTFISLSINFFRSGRG